MPRLSTLDPSQYTPEQRAVADAIIAGPRGSMRGPFEVWLRSPQFADRAQRLGEYCRYGSSLPRDLSELAIILTGRHWHAQYEFWMHARMAREAGLPDAIIEAIRAGAEPPLANEQQRVVYAFVREYFADMRVSEPAYRRALEQFGERGVVDLIGIVGYYGLVAMTLNVFEVPLPEGVEPPFA